MSQEKDFFGVMSILEGPTSIHSSNDVYSFLEEMVADNKITKGIKEGEPFYTITNNRELHEEWDRYKTKNKLSSKDQLQDRDVMTDSQGNRFVDSDVLITRLTGQDTLSPGHQNEMNQLLSRLAQQGSITQGIDEFGDAITYLNGAVTLQDIKNEWQAGTRNAQSSTISSTAPINTNSAFTVSPQQHETPQQYSPTSHVGSDNDIASRSDEASSVSHVPTESMSSALSTSTRTSYSPEAAPPPSLSLSSPITTPDGMLAIQVIKNDDLPRFASIGSDDALKDIADIANHRIQYIKAKLIESEDNSYALKHWKGKAAAVEAEVRRRVDMYYRGKKTLDQQNDNVSTVGRSRTESVSSHSSRPSNAPTIITTSDGVPSISINNRNDTPRYAPIYRDEVLDEIAYIANQRATYIQQKVTEAKDNDYAINKWLQKLAALDADVQQRVDGYERGSKSLARSSAPNSSITPSATDHSSYSATRPRRSSTSDVAPPLTNTSHDNRRNSVTAAGYGPGPQPLTADALALHDAQTYLPHIRAESHPNQFIGGLVIQPMTPQTPGTHHMLVTSVTSDHVYGVGIADPPKDQPQKRVGTLWKIAAALVNQLGKKPIIGKLMTISMELLQGHKVAQGQASSQTHDKTRGGR